jgi:hypothetical protein
MAKSFVGWALKKETIENFSAAITSFVKELPFLVHQIQRFTYWLSGKGAFTQTEKDKEIYEKEKEQVANPFVPKTTINSMSFGMRPNWKGGEVTGITNGLATVKAAPSEGLVSIGKGELIVPRDGRSQDSSKSLVINFNGPISASGNVGEIQAMFETALTRALQSMEVQL